MSLLNALFGKKEEVDFKALLAQGAFIIDVRTAGEFAGGHLAQSKNFPLDSLEKNIAKLPKDKAIIAVCRSGNRSGMATQMLKAKGYDAYNGGPWDYLKSKIA